MPLRVTDGASIDRYLRARRTHRLADTGALWVGASGKATATSHSTPASKPARKPLASKGSTRTCCGTLPLPAGCGPGV